MDAGQSALLHVQTPPQLGHPAQGAGPRRVHARQGRLRARSASANEQCGVDQQHGICTMLVFFLKRDKLQALVYTIRKTHTHTHMHACTRAHTHTPLTVLKQLLTTANTS